MRASPGRRGGRCGSTAYHACGTTAHAHALPDQARCSARRPRPAAPLLSSQDAFRARVQALLSRPDERVFGDETANEAYARFRTAVRAVMRTHAGNVAIVAHGTVIALLVARALHL